MGAEESKRYRIAVAMGNPDHAEQLTRTAVDIARDRDGEVFIIGVLVKRQESPFGLFKDEIITQEFGGERRAILERAMEVTSGNGVPVSGRLFVASSVARGVLHAVEEADCDSLLVGWQERGKRRLEKTVSGETTSLGSSRGPRNDSGLGLSRFVRQRNPENAVLGSNVDRIVRRADCDVLVEKIGALAGEVEDILLPVADSPHTELAASVARAIADANDARVNLLRIVESEREEIAARDLLAETSDFISGVEVETAIREGEVADVIVAESENRDVTVLGATRNGVIRRQIVGSIPQAVGRRAEGTIIMARKGNGSLMSRVFRL